jgi:cold shock CspA family protein
VEKNENIDNPDFFTGIVANYDTLKGFGFIVEDGNLAKVFVHVTGINDQIKAGMRVRYQKDATRNDCAFDVTILR